MNSTGESGNKTEAMGIKSDPFTRANLCELNKACFNATFYENATLFSNISDTLISNGCSLVNWKFGKRSSLVLMNKVVGRIYRNFGRKPKA